MFFIVFQVIILLVAWGAMWVKIWIQHVYLIQEYTIHIYTRT